MWELRVRGGEGWYGVEDERGGGGEVGGGG